MSVNHRRTGHIIQSFESKSLKKRNWAYKFADAMTSFFGSVPFLIINIVLAGVWILINTERVDGIPIFDPFPFVLLTTVLSLEAIFLTIVVLISQARQNQTTTIRDELELQVNLIAEREITKILRLLKKVLEKQGVEVSRDEELTEMLEDIDESYIERKLEDELTPKETNIVEKITEKVITPKNH